MPSTDMLRITDRIVMDLVLQPLRPAYRDEKDLRGHVGEIIKQCLAREYAKGQFQVLVAGQDDGATKPVQLLGTDFWPDIEVREGDNYFLAAEVKLVGDNASGISTGIGRAFIHSLQFPWVIIFVLDKGRKRDRSKHQWDHDLQSSLWHKHNVKLVLR